MNPVIIEKIGKAILTAIGVATFKYIWSKAVKKFQK